MKGQVIQFRQGRKTQKPRHFLLEVPGCDKREKAKKFEGKEVIWTSPSDKKIKGKIASAHGNKGVLRAIFEVGLPGQAIGTPVDIEGTASDKSEKKIEKLNKTDTNSEKKA